MLAVERVYERFVRNAAKALHKLGSASGQSIGDVTAHNSATRSLMPPKPTPTPAPVPVKAVQLLGRNAPAIVSYGDSRILIITVQTYIHGFAAR